MEKCSHSARNPLALPPAAGSVTRKEQLGDVGREPGLAHRLDGGDDLHQRLRRAAGLGDDDEARWS